MKINHHHQPRQILFVLGNYILTRLADHVSDWGGGNLSSDWSAMTLHKFGVERGASGDQYHLGLRCKIRGEIFVRVRGGGDELLQKLSQINLAVRTWSANLHVVVERLQKKALQFRNSSPVFDAISV